MVSSLDGLPDETLHHILRYCDSYSAASLEQAARRFRRVTNEALLWRLYCQTDFNVWDSRHNMPAKSKLSASMVDWKGLYASRCLTNRAVIRILDSIVSSQTRRIEKYRAVLDFGYDAEDILLLLSHAEVSTEDYLARRFALLPVKCFMQIFLTCGYMGCPSKDTMRSRSWLVSIGASPYRSGLD